MSRSSAALTAMFTLTGTVHLAAPRVFDPALPDWLPGSKRAWALGSGAAELACAALVAAPSTRRLGGYASAALLVGVNAGPLVTPWASLATLLWAARCRSAGVEVSWWRFARRGLVLVPVLLVGATTALWLA